MAIVNMAAVQLYCSVLKLTDIVILLVYYTILFGFSLILAATNITFQLFNYFVWLTTTDEDLLPGMHI